MDRFLTNPEHMRRRLVTLSILALSILASNAASFAANAGPSAVVDGYFAAYRAADLDGLIAHYAPNVEFVDVSQRHNLEGQEAMREQLETLISMHKKLDVEVKRRATAGSLVTVEVVYTGTLDLAAFGQDDGKELSYSIPAVLLFEVAEGRIASQTDYLDFRSLTELQARVTGQ